MPDAPAVAESSPAPVSQPIEIPRSGADYAEWRKTGNLPQPKEEAAPAAAKPESSDAPPAETKPAAEAETAPAPEPEHEGQESETRLGVRGRGAEARIKQLLAENKRLKQQAETATRPPEPAPVKAAEPAKPAPPANYQEWRKTFNPAKFVETWGKDNPKGSYEEAVAAMNDHMDEVRSGFRQREETQATAQREFNAKLEETRKRYPDMDKVIGPASRALITDEKVSPVVKALINDSEVFADLLYVMGSDQAELDSFLQDARSNPGAAIRRLVLVENLVKEELAGKKEQSALSTQQAAERDAATGKFVKSGAPEKKISDAPPPPTEVSGRMTPPGDAVADAVKTGDFASYRARRNARDLESRKG